MGVAKRLKHMRREKAAKKAGVTLPKPRKRVDSSSESDDEGGRQRKAKRKKDKIKAKKKKAAAGDEPEAERDPRDYLTPRQARKRKRDLLANKQLKNFHRRVDPATAKVKDFKKSFYPATDADMTEEKIRAARQRIGVVVRLGACPPPLTGPSDLKMPTIIRRLLKRMEFDTLTPIQLQALPAILSGHNVVGLSPTGTGKTLAFLLPLLSHIGAQHKLAGSEGPIGLVLVPTRELAAQVERVCIQFNRLFGIRCVSLFGGVAKEDQLDRLVSPTHIIAATPGRLVDLMEKKELTLKRVTYVVLDEADRMLALGFKDQVVSVLSHVRDDRQTHLFSATYPKAVQEAVEAFVAAPVVIRAKVGFTDELEEEVAAIDAGETVATEASPATGQLFASTGRVPATVEQIVHVVRPKKRIDVLAGLLRKFRAKDKAEGQRHASLVLVFCNSIADVETLCVALNTVAAASKTDKALRCVGLHGQLPQQLREQALGAFRSGRRTVLIATDVAGRGLDVVNIKLVVNYSMPQSLDQYIHRVGRTGRNGTKGTAYSFFDPDTPGGLGECAA